MFSKLLAWGALGIAFVALFDDKKLEALLWIITSTLFFIRADIEETKSKVDILALFLNKIYLDSKEKKINLERRYEEET